MRKALLADLEPTPHQDSFTQNNAGLVAGEEIAQLYIAKRDSQLFRSALELKGFTKIHLEPGESQRVAIP